MFAFIQTYIAESMTNTLDYIQAFIITHLLPVLVGLMVVVALLVLLRKLLGLQVRLMFRGIGWSFRNDYLRPFLCVPLGWLLQGSLSYVLNAAVDAQALSYAFADISYNAFTTGLMMLAMSLRRHWLGECLLALLTGIGCGCMGLLNFAAPESFRLGLYLSLTQQSMVMVAVALIIALTARGWKPPTLRLPAWRLPQWPRRASKAPLQLTLDQVAPPAPLSIKELEDWGLAPNLATA
ncbi:MAG: hypothetical protein B7X02_00040 [Rhodospirillales bacterium 12-54-5]|nr:MAG: hypothetical protein B7X02_00040 [Rhodospirillales bacterium 12-54-5]